MTMDDYEPACGYNLPPGCMDVPAEPEARVCGWCRHYIPLVDALGVCGVRLDEAEAGGDLGILISTRLVCAWIADSAVGESDDAGGCPDYEEQT